MKKRDTLKSESITFDEFIDVITENRGDEIKKQIRLIEKKSQKD